MQNTMIQTKRLLIATILLLAAPIAVWCQQDASSSQEVLTLEEAIATALGKNHLVRNAELDVGKADSQLAAIRTARLPSLHMNTIFLQQLVKQDIRINDPLSHILPGLGPFFSISGPRKLNTIFGVSALQPLSEQYRIGLNIEQAKLARDVKGEQLRQRQQSTINDVKRIYYGILQAQSALKSLHEAIRLYRELDRVTGDYVAQQVSLKSDLMEVKTRLAKAEYEAIVLGNQLETEKEQLNHLIGRDVRTDFTVSEVPGIGDVNIDLASARRLALDQRPEVRESRLKIRLAELDRRAKKSEYIPDVGIGFSYLTLRNFDDIIPKNFASLGVIVRWEIFDWGRKRDQLSEKEKTIEQAKNGLHETESLVLIEVGDKFRRLQQSRQALIVAQLAQETAREVLRINTNRYKVSAAILSDVLQSQASLAEANNQYQQALLGYWTAKAQFEKAIGEEK